MTTNYTPVTLAPIRQHHELAGQDEATLTLFADTLGIDLIPNWDGQPATTIADAWRIREHFDTESVRAAEAAAARLAQALAEDEAQFGPIRRRANLVRRQANNSAQELPDVPFAEERWRDWEAKVDELGEARFMKIEPAPVPDTRTPLERIRDKEA